MLNKLMVYSGVFIGLYILSSSFSYLGLLPISPEVFTLVKPIVGRDESIEVQMFMPAVTTVLFLNPFLLNYYLLGTYKRDGVKGGIVLISLLFSMLAIILSGRRTLMLNLLLAPVVTFLFIKFSKVKLQVEEKRFIKKAVFGFIILIFLLMFLLAFYDIFDFKAFWEFFIRGFDFAGDSDVGSTERGSQFHLMLKSWFDYPIFGTGLGSSSQYVIRSEATPFVYELSYLAILFQTGIVGFTIYLGLLGWIFVKFIKLVRINREFRFFIPSFVGCFCFLVGNGSNPYLSAFDHMWAVFLPMALINYCDLKKKQINLDNQI